MKILSWKVWTNKEYGQELVKLYLHVIWQMLRGDFSKQKLPPEKYKKKKGGGKEGETDTIFKWIS